MLIHYIPKYKSTQSHRKLVLTWSSIFCIFFLYASILTSCFPHNFFACLKNSLLCALQTSWLSLAPVVRALVSLSPCRSTVQCVKLPLAIGLGVWECIDSGTGFKKNEFPLLFREYRYLSWKLTILFPFNVKRKFVINYIITVVCSVLIGNWVHLKLKWPYCVIWYGKNKQNKNKKQD